MHFLINETVNGR